MSTNDAVFRTATLALLTPLFIVLGACADEPPAEEEFPETATVEEVEPEEELGERIEWDDETVFTGSDVGRAIVSTGTVVGVGADGFLLSTEGGRVLYVQTDDQVELGAAVEAVGTLASLETVVLEEVETEMFGDEGFEAEWEVEELYYVAGAVVGSVDTTM